MSDLFGSWDSLATVEQFFYIVAGVSTLVFLLQLLMTLIGIGSDGVDGDGVDFSHDVDMDHPDMEAHSTGLGMISVRTVLAFMVGFGWTGVVAVRMGSGVLTAVAAGLVAGFLFMVMIFQLMKMIYSLSDSGNVDIRLAAGRAGTVYTPVPGSRSGIGQVQVVVQGRMRELPAVTDEESLLPTGTPITVQRVLEGGTALVKKQQKEEADNAD